LVIWLLTNFLIYKTAEDAEDAEGRGCREILVINLTFENLRKFVKNGFVYM